MKADWMKCASLPWVNLVATRWAFTTFWHFGPLKFWVSSSFVSVIWRYHSRIVWFRRNG